MPTGFGVLFALFGGVPLWFWLHSMDTYGRPAPSAASAALSFLICIALGFAVGAIAGYAVKRIRHG